VPDKPARNKQPEARLTDDKGGFYVSEVVFFSYFW
jgi:hypothetical protein